MSFYLQRAEWSRRWGEPIWLLWGGFVHGWQAVFTLSYLIFSGFPVPPSTSFFLLYLTFFSSLSLPRSIPTAIGKFL